MHLHHVLVTGAAGLIGSATCRLLRERGINVTALALPGSETPGITDVVEGDVTDPTVVASAFSGADGAGVDAVVHLAAIPHPDIDTPATVFRTNVVGTFEVLSAAAEHGVRRAVIASSINASGVPFHPAQAMPAYFPLDETLPARPGDAYSLSKATDESSARMAADLWGLDVVALRFPFVGAGERLARVLARVRQNPDETVREGWSYLHTDDAAGAVLAALTAPISGAHVVGLAADDTLLVEPTEEALRRWAPGVPIRTPLPGRASGVDTSRARELLDFRPTYSIGAELDAAG